MINIFKKSHFILLPILLLIIIAFNLVTFIHPVENTLSFAAPLAKLCNAPFIYLETDHVFSSRIILIIRQIIIMIIIFAQALMLNNILQKHAFVPTFSNIPALSYVLFSCLFTEFLTYNPVLPANFFLILMVDRFFSLYKSDKPLKQTFDIGFLIGLASLLYFPVAILMLLFIIVLMILRSFNLRDWIVGFIAFGIPYFLAVSFFYWSGSLSGFGNDHFLNFFDVATVMIDLTLIQILLISFTGLILLLALNRVRTTYQRIVVKIRNYLIVLIWFLIIGAITFIGQPSLDMTHFMILIVPVSVLIGYYFQEMKNNLMVESIFIVFLVLIFLNQYAGI